MKYINLFKRRFKMDEMNLVSKFMTKIVSGIMSKALEKQLGCKVDLQLNEVKVKFDGVKALMHLDVDAELRTADITKITSKFM
jgi:hypothetical protein